MAEVVDALQRALKAHGVPAERARRLAVAQYDDIEAEQRRRHHIVPVTTGWLVITTVALADAEVFADQEDAIARARQLAAAVSGTVVLHGADGHSITFAPD